MCRVRLPEEILNLTQSLLIPTMPQTGIWLVCIAVTPADLLSCLLHGERHDCFERILVACASTEQEANHFLLCSCLSSRIAAALFVSVAAVRTNEPRKTPYNGGERYESKIDLRRIDACIREEPQPQMPVPRPSPQGNTDWSPSNT